MILLPPTDCPTGSYQLDLRIRGAGRVAINVWHLNADDALVRADTVYVGPSPMKPGSTSEHLWGKHSQVVMVGTGRVRIEAEAIGGTLDLVPHRFERIRDVPAFAGPVRAVEPAPEVATNVSTSPTGERVFTLTALDMS